MGKWPHLGERIGQRLQELGYVKSGRPDVMRFALEKQWPVTYIYKWLRDTTPDRANLYRLAKDLDVSPAWLLFGDEVKKAGKRLAVLLLALTTALVVPPEPGTPYVAQALEKNAPYLSFLGWFRTIIGHRAPRLCMA